MQIPALTGLRAVAALHVFVFHAAFAYPFLKTASTDRLISAGLIGVTVFFILSGFVLGISQVKPGGMAGDWRAFWSARAGRILPNYYAAVLVMLVLWPLLAITSASDPTPLQFLGVTLASLTLTQTWVPWMVFEGHGQAWSLNVEAVFYLLFPQLALWTARRRTPGLLVGLLGAWACIVGIATLYTEHQEVMPWLTAYANPLFRLPEFVVGVLLARLYALRPTPANGWAAVAALSWGAVVLILTLHGRGFDSVPQLHPVLVPLIGLGLYSTARAPLNSLVAALLGNRVMIHLGHISYSVYLWHGAALLIAQNAFHLTGWAGVGGAALLTLALSETAYWGIERPAATWWKRRAGPGRSHVSPGLIQADTSTPPS